MSLITCDNISLSYDTGNVLSGLSFEVNSGDYLCIVGENGSGKSTLIKALLGLKKPARGSITFGDGLKQNEIGYVPQQTSVQRDFPATVTEVVQSGLLNNFGFKFYFNKAEKQRVREVMEKLEITDIAKKSYRELSGGQQQRVILARALCATKKILLLDEPVSGLDPAMTLTLYRLIKRLNEEENITIIMVSHDINAATKYSNKMLHIHKQKTFFGSTRDYLSCPACLSFEAENAFAVNVTAGGRRRSESAKPVEKPKPFSAEFNPSTQTSPADDSCSHEHSDCHSHEKEGN